MDGILFRFGLTVDRVRLIARGQEMMQARWTGRRPLLTLLCLFALCAGSAASWPPAAARFVIVNKGRAVATIVIPAHATGADRRAADILRAAVARMSGAQLPVAERDRPGAGASREVLIGFSRDVLPRTLAADAARLREDGFLVASSGNKLYVVSGGHKGSVYGVVHLLEKYSGCRKFSPSADLFPTHVTLALPNVRDLENPVNEFRVVNGEFSRDEAYRDWQRLDTTDEVFGRGYYVHTFNKLVPPDQYFAAHPEYFAFVNGKRIRDQLCPSRPEVLAIAAKQLAKEMAAQPDRRVWSVSQNDNFSYCQCDECRRVIEEEGSPAGPIARLVNQVAARFPDKVISTLAYQYSRKAPKVTRPAANVQVMLCTIELNRSLPIADDPGSRSFLMDIVEWGRISRNIYLWDYTVNFNHHVSPFPNLHVLQPNLQFFVHNGARQHFQQSNTSAGHEFSELKNYLIARLLWNPDADAEAVKREFLDGYYGAAAPWIAKYIVALQEALARSGAKLDIYEPPVAHADTYLSAANVATYNELFDQAEASVRGDAIRLERVRTARLPLQYAMLEIGKNDMFGPRGFWQGPQAGSRLGVPYQGAGRFELRPAMKQLLDDFYATCTRNGVTTLSEQGLTPKAYYESALRFIDVQVEGNLAFRKRVVAEPAPSPKYGKGDVSLLTNGVRGAHDFRVHWLGWEGPDFALTVDLEAPTSAREASIGTLWSAQSWILYPRRVTCLVSADGEHFEAVGSQGVEGDQRQEEITRTFAFTLSGQPIRAIRFQVEGTHQLPEWHPSAGGTSWVFVDEIVVR
jgi:hypothetical protein